ncbi:alpha/beta hydrolase [Actinophytocola sp.]|uniref:alpha/beta hydrolase n=1 Tax=Actinophytocola sp. TaxID=1872138 RepID=UPI0025BED8BC|nr:alpha/beta hydrolase [Actinophytocola sp.]
MITTRSRLFLVAGLSAMSSLGLAVSLRFPELLLDDPALAGSLGVARTVASLASLLGLLAAGAGLVALARAFTPKRRLVTVLGLVGGLSWVASALLGLVLVPLWANGGSAGVRPVAGIAFGCFTIVAPLALAGWTVGLVRRLGRARVTGVLGALGLVLTVGRSVLWAVDAALPAVDGYYVASAIVTVLALLGFPMWLFWLVRIGSTLDGDRPRLAVALLGVVAVLAQVAVTTAGTPVPAGDGVPSVPSVGGSAIYLLMLAIADMPPTSREELLAQRQDDHHARVETPPGATLESVDMGGVPAERICAGGAAADRAVLYLHGGGFVLPLGNGGRRLAAALSRASGGCAFVPNYRLAPEHPFPAQVEDSVRAYRWLRGQGIAASRMVIAGDSAGATVTLSTALSLRDSGDELPAALVALSPATDFTLSGATHRTKAASDAVLGPADVAFSVRSYLGATDPRDPLASPLYAEVHGLPPTLLMAAARRCWRATRSGWPTGCATQPCRYSSRSGRA